MRYRLRTLMIVLALGPPILAAIIWVAAAALSWAAYRRFENAAAARVLLPRGPGIQIIRNEQSTEDAEASTDNLP